MEPNYEEAFGAPDSHHEGMSPNTAQTAVREDHGGESGAARSEVGSREAVAVRAMAVAVTAATSSPTGEPAMMQPPLVQPGEVEYPGLTQEAFLHGHGVQTHGMAATWNGGSPAKRGVLPMWVQRLGTFFQEMRDQQRGQPWMPSPFPSTPMNTQRRQRMLGSPSTDPGPAVAPLFTREQRVQARRMERRAPLIYGPGVPQGEGSSGGSTVEAVQEEVRRQLRGVMDELAEPRREAGTLREEVRRLRDQAEARVQPMPQPEGLPKVYGGYLVGPENAATSLNMPRVSGDAATSSSMPGLSGVAATSSSMPGVSGTAATSSSMPGVSGIAATSSSMPGVSGTAATSSSMPGVSGIAATSSSMPGVSGTAATSSSTPGVPGQAATTTRTTQDVAIEPTRSTTTGGNDPTTTNGDAVTKLLQGLEAVLTKNHAKTQEEVTKSVVEAPKLAELSEASAIDFGDWLHCLENVMGDLSANSGEWWRAVLDDAQNFYHVEEDQFARLALKPVASSEAADSKWIRVDRGSAIILNAVPEDVKKELVASRSRSTLELLAKLMVMYRPGSTTEKSQLLKRVEAPEAANNVSEAVDYLRQWSRYYKRAKDLKLSTPDPSLLLRALDGLVRRPLQENQDIAFRMSLLRYHLKVDFAPTEDSTLAIHRAYLAEFEQMGYKKYKPGGQQQQPKIKAAELPQGSVPMPSTTQRGTTRPCKFFLSDDGCRRGKDCKYEHSMNNLSKAEKRDRCYVCGAKGHLSSNCPTKNKDKPAIAAVQGDSPQSSTGGTSTRKGQGSRVDAVSEGGSTAPPSTTSTTTTSAAPTQVSEVQGVPVEQLLEDAQKLMKAFMQQSTPCAKALRVRGADWDELPALRELDADGSGVVKRMGLLDSGATHAMRPRTPNDELKVTRTAEVTLAGDQKMEFPQTQSGVILAGPEAQPIVPLGSLIRALGYEFVWGRKGCVLRHPERPDVKVYDKSSCPEVRECDALRLIAELESEKVGEAMKSLDVLRTAIQVSKQRQPWDWWDAVKRYVTEGTRDTGNQAVMAAPFMSEVPMELRTQVLEAIPETGREAWKALKGLPFNRAKRRALWESDAWIVHMFAGERFHGDPLQHGPGELLELDLRRGTSLINPEVYGVLLWAAKHRKIKHVIGGPPSRTFSPLRGRDDVKALDVVRSPEELWGVGEGLQWEDRVIVNSENRMILRMMWLWMVAEAAMCDKEQPQHSKVGLCMEHPEDPRCYLPSGDVADRSVSLWRTMFVKNVRDTFGLEEVAFDQGVLGNPQRRPTRCLTNLELGLQGLRDSRTSWPQPMRGEDPSVWPHGFREALCSAMKLWSKAMETDVATKAMSAKEVAKWKEHLDNNHFPYRRDGSVCVQASGTGRPARKVEHRDAFVLSLDVAGPFATKGVDENRGSKHRFVLVGSYTFPKIKEVPPEEELPEEEQPEEEEFFPMEDVEPDEGVDIAEDPSLDEQEKEWERTVGELKKPVEMQTLKFCAPVEYHRGRTPCSPFTWH